MSRPVAVVVSSRWEAMALGLVAGIGGRFFASRQRFMGFTVMVFLVTALSPLLWDTEFDAVCLTVSAEQDALSSFFTQPESPVRMDRLRELLLSDDPAQRQQGLEVNAALGLVHPLQAWLWASHAERSRI